MIKFLDTVITNGAMLGAGRLLNITRATFIVFHIHYLVKGKAFECLFGLFLISDDARIRRTRLVKTIVAREHDYRAYINMVVGYVWSWDVSRYNHVNINGISSDCNNKVKYLYYRIGLVHRKIEELQNLYSKVIVSEPTYELIKHAQLSASALREWFIILLRLLLLFLTLLLRPRCLFKG